jgi:hypothetical protein
MAPKSVSSGSLGTPCSLSLITVSPCLARRVPDVHAGAIIAYDILQDVYHFFGEGSLRWNH